MVQNIRNRKHQKTSNGEETQRNHSDTDVHYKPKPTHSSTPISMAPTAQQTERKNNKRNQKKTKEEKGKE